MNEWRAGSEFEFYASPCLAAYLNHGLRCKKPDNVKEIIYILFKEAVALSRIKQPMHNLASNIVPSQCPHIALLLQR